jgi:hypothetical protein
VLLHVWLCSGGMGRWLLTAGGATAVTCGWVEAQRVVHAGAVACSATRFAGVETGRHGFASSCLALEEGVEGLCVGDVARSEDHLFVCEGQWQGHGQECDREMHDCDDVGW